MLRPFLHSMAFLTVLTPAMLCAEPAGTPAEAQATPLRPLADPVPVKLVTRQGQVVRGEAVAWNEGRVVVTDEQEARVELAWDALFPSMVFTTYRQLMDARDAEQWVRLGRVLRGMPGGLEHSESALQVAALLDETLAERIEAVRQMPAPPEAPVTTRSAGSPLSASVAAPTTGIDRSAPPPADPADYTWGDLFPLDRAIHVEEAKAFAQEVAGRLGIQFTEVETDHFLYYSNVPPGRTYQSPRLLDQMYDKACELYRVPRGTELFKGKCTVFMFATQEQFQEYTRHFGGHAWAAGFCQTAGDGAVRIVMFQGDDQGYTTQTMLHETAHGVNWRYRAPVALPPWLEEGVAEWVASNTTGNFRYVKAKRRIGVEHVRKSPRLGANMFDMPGIRETWEYGLAYDMVNTLIQKDRDKFVELVDLIKDGHDWEWALQETYRVTADDFFTRYGKTIGVPQLSR